MDARPAQDLPNTHHHAVQFYGSDASLFRTVAGFLSEGLISGQPAIVIATEAHRQSIVEHLCGRLIDCARATRTGDLVILDAAETLGSFMVNGLPDLTLFEQNVGGIIAQMLRGRGQIIIRAYGEMVDVLWKRGEPEAAIQLEMLWNKLATKHNFALLCGYAMGSFYKQTSYFEEICRQHTKVFTHDTNVVSFDPARPRQTA